MFLDADEAGLFALHGALARLLRELVQTYLVESFFTFLALPGLHEDGVAKGAKQVLRHHATWAISINHIRFVECE